MTSSIVKLAIEESEKSTYKQRIGCVIFKGSRILSSGHNDIRSSRIIDKYKIFKNALHAEQAAVLKVKEWHKLKGASIIVIKTTKPFGLLKMAKPCPMCQELLRHVCIKNIYYSNEFGEIVKMNDW